MVWRLPLDSELDRLFEAAKAADEAFRRHRLSTYEVGYEGRARSASRRPRRRDVNGVPRRPVRAPSVSFVTVDTFGPSATD